MEASDASASVELQRAYFADIASRYPGWSPLDTGDLQPEALGLFRSAGYEQISDYNGNAWATFWMEKRLA